MPWKIRRCKNCWAYTLLETCPYCGSETKVSHPPRFSPLDPYGKYRRMLILEHLGDDNGSNKSSYEEKN